MRHFLRFLFLSLVMKSTFGAGNHEYKIFVGNATMELEALPVASHSEDEDEALNEYFMDILDGLRAVMTTGLHLLDLPVLDPLSIASKVWEFKNQNTRFVAAFHNVSITGLSTFQVRMLNVKLRQLTVDLRVFLPELSAKGLYTLNGKAVYVLPLRGDGEWESHVRNLTINAKVRLELAENRSLRLRMLSILGEVAASNIRFDNLLDRGNMGIIVNNIVQRNSRRIINQAIGRLRQNIENLIEPFSDIIDAEFIFELHGQTYTNVTSI